MIQFHVIRSLPEHFFWIKYAEEVGTGTNKLVDWCREWGLPDPDFEDTGSTMVTTFRHPFITESKVQDVHLNERQKKALKYIKEKNSISRKEYVLLNKISTRQANRDINELLRNKIISIVSKGRGTRYTVK